MEGLGWIIGSLFAALVGIITGLLIKRSQREHIKKLKENFIGRKS